MKRIFLALCIIASLAACTRIETGNIGVEKTLGQVKQDELPPGVYFTVFKTVLEVNGKENSISMDDLKPKSKENLTMQDFDFDVYYQINGAKAADILVKYAGDISEDNDGNYVLGSSLVTRQAREAAYNAAVRQEFAQMQNRRAELAADIQAGLQKELDASAGKGAFTVTNVVIKNITTDAALEKSIREAADVEFQTRKKEAELKLAEAEAARKKVEAEGQAAANRIISESLTPQLVQVKQIEAMEKFSGAKEVTVLLGTDATPLVQVK